MDLGATECKSRHPACATCPLRTVCRSAADFASGRASPTAVRRTPSYRFEESNRFYRGRVLAALRSLDEDAAEQTGIELRELGQTVRADFQEEHLDWLSGVVRSLSEDGLAVLKEERPTYDAGPVVRVKLP